MGWVSGIAKNRLEGGCHHRQGMMGPSKPRSQAQHRLEVLGAPRADITSRSIRKLAAKLTGWDMGQHYLGLSMTQLRGTDPPPALHHFIRI